MSDMPIDMLFYIAFLCAAVIGLFMLPSRKEGDDSGPPASVWTFLALGAIGGIGLWGNLTDERLSVQRVGESGAITVPRESDGHYYLTLDVNGVPVRFVFDTGATEMVLTLEDAARVGLEEDRLAFFGSASTANGIVRTAPVVLDEVSLGGGTDYRVRAWVNEGEMEESLLGMGYLQRFDRIEITGDELILER
ncbi:TIGR02281 family clan AA aspartic protease [Aestuariibius sp. 2305UL40-4]|uniref:retropepsin-like aspartic protease family protein n=1 Tax=Aestuariibius violaceus TaxID=3234132 RepID=UPI00345EC076